MSRRLAFVGLLELGLRWKVRHSCRTGYLGEFEMQQLMSLKWEVEWREKGGKKEEGTKLLSTRWGRALSLGTSQR